MKGINGMYWKEFWVTKLPSNHNYCYQRCAKDYVNYVQTNVECSGIFCAPSCC